MTFMSYEPIYGVIPPSGRWALCKGPERIKVKGWDVLIFVLCSLCVLRIRWVRLMELWCILLMNSMIYDGVIEFLECFYTNVCET